MDSLSNFRSFCNNSCYLLEQSTSMDLIFLSKSAWFWRFGIHFDWLLRILIAVPLLVGPILCFLIIRQFSNHWRNSLYFILGSCIIPLSLLLLVLSAFKEVLPHWIMPCIWLGIPAAVLAVVDQRYWNGTLFMEVSFYYFCFLY